MLKYVLFNVIESALLQALYLQSVIHFNSISNNWPITEISNYSPNCLAIFIIYTLIKGQLCFQEHTKRGRK